MEGADRVWRLRPEPRRVPPPKARRQACGTSAEQDRSRPVLQPNGSDLERLDQDLERLDQDLERRHPVVRRRSSWR